MGLVISPPLPPPPTHSFNYRLDRHVQAPDIVRALSLGEVFKGDLTRRADDYRPYDRFFLAGHGGSFTTWHVDAGGSAVFYHPMKVSCSLVDGVNEYLILTEQNSGREDLLRRYPGGLPPLPEVHEGGERERGDRERRGERRLHRGAHREGDDLQDHRARGAGKPIHSASLNSATYEHPFQTLFLPSMWPHCVYTPRDALVIGGNFLHPLNFKRQAMYAVFCVDSREGTYRSWSNFRVREWEITTKVPESAQFPDHEVGRALLPAMPTPTDSPDPSSAAHNPRNHQAGGCQESAEATPESPAASSQDGSC